VPGTVNIYSADGTLIRCIIANTAGRGTYSPWNGLMMPDLVVAPEFIFYELKTDHTGNPEDVMGEINSLRMYSFILLTYPVSDGYCHWLH